MCAPALHVQPIRPCSLSLLGGRLACSLLLRLASRLLAYPHFLLVGQQRRNKILAPSLPLLPLAQPTRGLLGTDGAHNLIDRRKS